MTNLVSSDPVVAVKTHLDEMCISCQGFTIVGEGGRVVIQGAYQTDKGKHSFLGVLETAQKIREALYEFMVKGRAAQLDFCKKEIERYRFKLEGLSGIHDSQRVKEFEKHIGYYQDIILSLPKL